jgi:uncharacterized protein
MKNFIGRDLEYQRLKAFLKSPTASFIVIKGRRRVGKSTLVERFSDEFPQSYTFTGLAPEQGLTAKDQRLEFCRQLALQFNLPNPQYDDWGDIFWALADRLKKGRLLLFLDEVSWMARGDKTFLPKLKDAWDRFYKKNSKLILVVCASASSWIEENILSSTAFVGRVSYVMNLKPLALNVCKEFWGKVTVSAYEKLKIIAVTGCIPRYLEEIQPGLSAEENVKRLCFTPGGLLVNEFEKIFNDLFLHNSHFYRSILLLLSNGAKQFKEICQELSLPASGRISNYLSELEEVGFIKRYYSWSIKTGKESKISLYRLSDNYLRFYFKYINPNRKKINEDKFAFQSLSVLPGWDSIIAIQVENLIINNRDLLIKSLNIPKEDIIADGPYFQRATKQYSGCQIDYMFQTRYNTIYICEIKFSKSSTKKSVISEVTGKIDRLVLPKQFSIRPVLIHVNGIDPAIEKDQYFSEIIDITDWL